MVGAGPAGSALAAACAGLGLRTVLLDRAPDRPWRATYGAWADELPELPASAIAASASTVRVFASTAHVLDRRYVVLRNEGLRSHLRHPDVEVRAGRVVAMSPRAVRLADGSELTARVVVDATGAPRGLAVEQTAVGVVLPASCGILGADEAVFMDWRQVMPGDPTFCYMLPLGGDRVLVEETSLARRPGLPFSVLRERLAARLTAHGLPWDGPEELVRFPLDVPIRRGMLGYGVSGGFIHPATGYSVATSLSLAPVVARSILSANSSVHRTIWPLRARLVHALRRRGLQVLLSLPPEDVPRFFELFFSLPSDLQRAYLSSRADPRATAAAMLALFRSAPWRLRSAIAFAATTR